MPETEKAYYVGTHRYSFRSGQPAEIVGVVMANPDGRWRPCFQVLYPDGVTDMCAIEDTANYKIQREHP